jgi:hypothetical protein
MMKTILLRTNLAGEKYRVTKYKKKTLEYRIYSTLETRIAMCTAVALNPHGKWIKFSEPRRMRVYELRIYTTVAALDIAFIAFRVLKQAQASQKADLGSGHFNRISICLFFPHQKDEKIIL